jgi:hypothetical protein
MTAPTRARLIHVPGIPHARLAVCGPRLDRVRIVADCLRHFEQTRGRIFRLDPIELRVHQSSEIWPTIAHDLNPSIFSRIAEGINRKYAFSIIANEVPVWWATVNGSMW